MLIVAPGYNVKVSNMELKVSLSFILGDPDMHEGSAVE